MGRKYGRKTYSYDAYSAGPFIEAAAAVGIRVAVAATGCRVLGVSAALGVRVAVAANSVQLRCSAAALGIRWLNEATPNVPHFPAATAHMGIPLPMAAAPSLLALGRAALSIPVLDTGRAAVLIEAHAAIILPISMAADAFAGKRWISANDDDVSWGDTTVDESTWNPISAPGVELNG